MAAPAAKNAVQQLLERAHSPDTATQIFTDKIQFRQLLLRPTSPTAEIVSGPAGSGSGSGVAVDAAAAAASGLDGRDARRRARRLKQERRQVRLPKPKPLSSRQRRQLGLYYLPTKTSRRLKGPAAKRAGEEAPTTTTTAATSYATFVPLNRLWLGYIREVLGTQDLRNGGPGAAAKLTAADVHGAAVEVTRSACVGRVGIRGIVVRDTRFVFEIVTPDNKVKMVPKEGTFFRIAIPVDDDDEDDDDGGGGGGGNNDEVRDINGDKTTPGARGGRSTKNAADHNAKHLVMEILGSQFMHRAADRTSRKFKQHFYKEL
ncbi:ribonuclease p complex subunit [Niveomyces insectorum RCEF 264]|uniref:Ribonuclease P protein subunit n=1 Tax=Niveomyces insectorum RCEF 264 TaxID=1081102 RepID=A0A168A654_9HYPO|nr:ribonuclease p complex subunit [Niveomyces insectorum RCEF 264]